MESFNSRTLYILDPLCKGYEHSQFNSDYISVLSRCAEFDKIVFYAEINHLNCIDTGISIESKVVKKPISISLNHSLKEIVKNIWILLRIFFVSKESKYPLIIFSCNKFLFVIIKFCAFVSRKNIILFLHNFIFELNDKNNSSFSLHNLLKLFNSALKIKYLVLSDFVRGNVLSIIPELNSSLFSVDLIIKNNEQHNIQKHKNSECINIKRKYIIGSAGVFSQSKGSFYFLKLVSDLHSSSLFNFKYAGCLDNYQIEKFNIREHMLDYYTHNLSNNEYNEIFSSFDFLILFYPKSSYRLGFSGIFLDLLRHEIPLIALKNDFFEFYFSKYGQLGWLFDDYDSLLNHLISFKNSNFDNEIIFFKANIRKAKVDFSENIVSTKLMSIVN